VLLIPYFVVRFCAGHASGPLLILPWSWFSSKVFFLGAGESLAPVDHELPVAAAVWWDFLREVRPLSPAWFLPSVSAEQTPPSLLRPMLVTLPAQFFFFNCKSTEC
jgi:hypothetical protein